MFWIVYPKDTVLYLMVPIDSVHIVTYVMRFLVIWIVWCGEIVLLFWKNLETEFYKAFMKDISASSKWSRLQDQMYGGLKLIRTLKICIIPAGDVRSTVTCWNLLQCILGTGQRTHGPQFISDEFRLFVTQNSIKHITSAVEPSFSKGNEECYRGLCFNSTKTKYISAQVSHTASFTDQWNIC